MRGRGILITCGYVDNPACSAVWPYFVMIFSSFNMLRPQFFVPIHGELRHLKQHGKIARELGIPKENIAVVENGYPLIFDDGHMEIGERVPGHHIFVDGALVGEVGPTVMRQREALGQKIRPRRASFRLRLNFGATRCRGRRKGQKRKRKIINFAFSIFGVFVMKKKFYPS